MNRVPSHACRCTAVASATLALCGLVLLVLGALAMWAMSASRFAQLAEDEAQASAQFQANALADQIQLAFSEDPLGPTPQALRASLQQHMPLVPAAAAVALLTPDGQVLWSQGSDDGRTLPAGLRASVAIRHKHGVVARLVLVARRPQPQDVLLTWAAPVLAWLAAVALLAREFLQLTWARGMQFSDAQTRVAILRIEQGNFSWRLPLSRGRTYDFRPRLLCAHMRHLNELHRRIRRLVHSLRQTEPDASRRIELDTMLEHATGGDRFQGDEAPLPIELELPLEERRWQGISAGLLPWMLGAAWAWLYLPWPRDTPAVWVATVLAVALCLGQQLMFWSGARRPGFEAACGGLALGAAVLGPGLVLPWLDLFNAIAQPDVVRAMTAWQWAVSVAAPVLLWRVWRATRPPQAHPVRYGQGGTGRAT